MGNGRSKNFGNLYPYDRDAQVEERAGAVY